jgi:hypothetical protein
MADQGRDPFDEEMDALRLEVGRFVLRLLKDDSPSNDVLDQVGERLARHVSDKARPVSALNADDRRFLDQLSRRVERLDGDVRKLRSSRAEAGVGVNADERLDQAGLDEPAEWGRSGGALGDRLGDLPRWLPWAVSAIVTTALIGTVAYVILGQRQALSDGTSPSEPVVAAGVEAALRWDTVLATVEAWPEDERTAALRVLCGEDAAEVTCPPWPERSAALSSDPEGRAAVARLVSQALAQADCSAPPLAGAGSDSPAPAVDPGCLLGAPE